MILRWLFLFVFTTISFYWAALILLLGSLSGVLRNITYLKGIRGEGKNHPYYELIFSGVFLYLGILSVLALSKKIRDEDELHHHLVLISNLALLLV